MIQMKTLNARQLEICANTISPNTFYLLVVHALRTKEALSVVRMGDGEKHFVNVHRATPRALLDELPMSVPAGRDAKEWMERMGLAGISMRALWERMEKAANNCTYFAPSISGLTREDYNLYDCFNPRREYVDNFFVNSWTEEHKIALFLEAGRVTFIHHNAETADAMQIRAKWGLQGEYGISVQVDFLQLSNWMQVEKVIDKACKKENPLVLFSAGPAGKWLGPEIADRTGAVVLDIGNAADQWTLESVKDKGRNSF